MSTHNLRLILQQSRQAARHMATLTTAQKNEALQAMAALIADSQPELLAANRQDVAAAQADTALSSVLKQRLGLDEAKLAAIQASVLEVSRLSDPVGQVQARTLLDEGLVLERRSVPLGVIAIIFESRPDVIPQILSLALKSGNAVVLKGGREALKTNQAFMQIVEQLQARCPFLPEGWSVLLDSREAMQAVLHEPDYIDLVIPRGSNELVQQIMATTRIPVLGHADGVCHLYVHASACLEKALTVMLDAKTQYPAACNALETVLIDCAIAPVLLPLLQQAALAAGVTLKGCPETQALLPCEPVSNWHCEHGDKTLAIRVLDGPNEAIAHINTHGSHHTDGVLAEEALIQQQFLNEVDSANVYVNASTRFADGFRYGFGAEVGISTARTHARGPVGLEGLVIYKYTLQGQYHCVSPYTGAQPKAFVHQMLPL